MTTPNPNPNPTSTSTSTVPSPRTRKSYNESFWYNQCNIYHHGSFSNAMDFLKSKHKSPLLSVKDVKTFRKKLKKYKEGSLDQHYQMKRRRVSKKKKKNSGTVVDSRMFDWDTNGIEVPHPPYENEESV